MSQIELRIFNLKLGLSVNIKNFALRYTKNQLYHKIPKTARSAFQEEYFMYTTCGITFFLSSPWAVIYSLTKQKYWLISLAKRNTFTETKTHLTLLFKTTMYNVWVNTYSKWEQNDGIHFIHVAIKTWDILQFVWSVRKKFSNFANNYILTCHIPFQLKTFII